MASTRETPRPDVSGHGRGRGRPVGQDSDQTRRTILATAQRLFGSSGYNGVSMEAIASECGLNVRALYYHFASKRDLFAAATDAAFGRFGEQVLALVLPQASARDRIRGYIDVYRTLQQDDPDLLPFIGMVLVDLLSAAPDTGAAERVASGSAHDLARFLELVVDDAIGRGEVNPDLDRDGAVMLLSVMGMGLALASLNDTGAYPAMLDALDLLVDGKLFKPTAES
jgi:AcrR family transcriptional regulator